MAASFDNLVLNTKTKAETQAYTKRPGHALMIIGQPGSGKTTLAKHIAGTILGSNDLENYPYYLHITRPENKKDIPIENIRAVLHKLRLKTTGNKPIRRVVFIEDAHLLSAESQNALLKAIEEPAGDTVFILSVHSDQGVLPTIASRAQFLRIQPISLNQANDYYSQQKSEEEINSAWQLSQGNVGLLHSLLFDLDENPLKNSVELAKSLLRMNSYQRILELDRLSKDKEQLYMLLVALGRVLAALHRVSSGKPSSNQRSIIKARKLVNTLQAALQANTSPRLIALELSLNLKV